MILLAVLLFAGATVGALALEMWIAQRDVHPALHAWLDHFALPFVRTLCVLVFLASAYPALFGVHDAPPLLDLLRGGERVSSWINALFFGGLLASMLPGLSRLPGLWLPVQGCAGVAKLFLWLAEARGVDASVLPSVMTAATLVGLALAASLAVRLIPDWAELRAHVRGVVRLWLQLPVLVVYGLHLGHRLP